ncbi:cholecystokinin receptor type A-like isoform X3 [Panulirus ornatus]|uniref:cholecystokinin receptor type A-like isoform X3 n=1 Tax=Panulirus ornatus TaxID=150431 RepID=UPI003A840A27
MRTITNVFLLNLAFSDLLLGVFCMPFTLVGSLLRDFIFGHVMCRLIPYFQAVSVSVSVWTLVAISLERYYAICQPLRSRGWQTLSHAYKIISLVWLLSLAFMAPIAALSQLLPVGDTSRHKCREMWPSLHLERGFSMFLGAGLLLVPLVIMVAAYFSITISLWHGMRIERETGQVISLTDLSGLAMVQQSLRSKHSRRHVSKISIRFRKIPAAQTRECERCGEPIPAIPGAPADHAHAPEPSQGDAHICLQGKECHDYKWHVESVRANGNHNPPQCKEPKPAFKRLRSTHLEKSIEAKRHVIKMLFVVVLEFFICWTPIFVVNIMCLYVPEQVYRALGSVGISFMHLLSYASSCCNPITYCFMNKKFLQGFRHAFGCRKENERMARHNGTAASFRSQSHNVFKLATEIKKDARETTV